MKMRLFVLLAVVFTAAARDKIALIEFFGYQGLNVDSIRKALPVHEGGWYEGKDKPALREAIKRITGKEPTDIASVCCEQAAPSLVYRPARQIHPRIPDRPEAQGSGAPAEGTRRAS